MNALVAEVMLVLEATGAELTIAEHIPGILNGLADALSRLSRGKRLPTVLLEAQRLPAVDRAKLFRAWPTDWAKNH